MRENDCRKGFVAIGNEDRGPNFFALFDHAEALNGDAFGVSDVRGVTKLAWMDFLGGTSGGQNEDCDAPD